MDREDLRNAVFTEKKNYGNVVREWGERTWLDYYTQDFANLTKPSEAVLSALEQETAQILGADVAQRARDSVAVKRWVSTADHHGLLMHPYFYGSSLAQSHSRTHIGGAHVVLPFGTVSLGNDSFPRGFFFHDAEGHEVRFHFQSLRYRRMPVCALAPFSKKEFTRESARVMAMKLEVRARERLAAFIEAVHADSRVWEQQTYSAQLTILNSIFWKQLFGDTRGELVYLDVEAVAWRLLLEHHLTKDTNLYQVFFNQLWREKFITQFNGVTGAHTGTSGTHFFWHVDYAERERVPLRVRGDTLASSDGSVEYKLEPESIARGLRARTLIPSTVVMMLLLTAEEGLSCAGGASQGDYLSHMATQWEVLIRDISGVPTKKTNTTIIAGDYTLFDIGDRTKSHASLMDISMYADNPAHCIDEALASSSVRETVDTLLPQVFRYTTHREASVIFLPAPAHIRNTHEIPIL